MLSLLFYLYLLLGLLLDGNLCNGIVVLGWRRLWWRRSLDQYWVLSRRFPPEATLGLLLVDCKGWDLLRSGDELARSVLLRWLLALLALALAKYHLILHI